MRSLYREIMLVMSWMVKLRRNTLWRWRFGSGHTSITFSSGDTLADLLVGDEVSRVAGGKDFAEAAMGSGGYGVVVVAGD